MFNMSQRDCEKNYNIIIEIQYEIRYNKMNAVKDGLKIKKRRISWIGVI